MNLDALAATIESAIGRRPVGVRALAGGCVADVCEVRLADGGICVAKSTPAGVAVLETWMLRYLRIHSRLPVPSVLWAGDDLLLLEYVESEGSTGDARAQEHAADLLADLHSVDAPMFGLECDTVIGGLPQPNPQSASWIEFFRDNRLLFMARRALDAGAVDAPLFAKLDRLCARLNDWIEEPPRPSLLHGDVWAGNVLVHENRVQAFIDPAIYYGDPEVELAFITLFSTFGRPFFDRYAELREISPGFFEIRRDVYNLYPLLVHATLFGGQYASAVRATLRRLMG